MKGGDKPPTPGPKKPQGKPGSQGQGGAKRAQRKKSTADGSENSPHMELSQQLKILQKPQNATNEHSNGNRARSGSHDGQNRRQGPRRGSTGSGGGRDQGNRQQDSHHRHVEEGMYPNPWWRSLTAAELRCGTTLALISSYRTVTQLMAGGKSCTEHCRPSRTSQWAVSSVGSASLDRTVQSSTKWFVFACYRSIVSRALNLAVCPDQRKAYRPGRACSVGWARGICRSKIQYAAQPCRSRACACGPHKIIRANMRNSCTQPDKVWRTARRSERCEEQSHACSQVQFRLCSVFRRQNQASEPSPHHSRGMSP